MAKHLEQHELYGYLTTRYQQEKDWRERECRREQEQDALGLIGRQALAALNEPRPIPDAQPSENGDCELCGEQLLDSDPDGFTEFYDGKKRVLAHGQCGIDAGMEMA